MLGAMRSVEKVIEETKIALKLIFNHIKLGKCEGGEASRGEDNIDHIWHICWFFTIYFLLNLKNSFNQINVRKKNIVFVNRISHFSLVQFTKICLKIINNRKM